MLLLIILLSAAYTVMGTFSATTLKIERQNKTTEALAQAKEALIGFAATYRDNHADEVFGYLPCPDTNNDGFAEPTCGLTDVSVIGRLPWKTLGLPPLRDDAAECLWYVVSGHAKDNPKTAAFNWDTTGQFVVQDAGGTMLFGVTAHNRPLAVILAPGTPLGAQSRSTTIPSECGGRNTATDYLEGLGALGIANTTLLLSNAESIRNASNNDQGQWITGKEIFERIKKRSDFKADIDSLLGDISGYGNTLATASLPIASLGSKGADSIISNFLAANSSYLPQKTKVLSNWRDNLLYAGGPSGNFTVNGSPTTCKALLFFSGERTTGQNRTNGTEKLTTTNYLENANLFPSNSPYTGATLYRAANPETDIVRCINGLPAGAASFANDFSSFLPAGAAVTSNVTVPSVPTVIIADASGSSGGCFWLPQTIPLAGKTLRAYYEFKFSRTDDYALTHPAEDRGNGFTFQMVRSDIGTPTTCGTETNMGALGTSDMWGSKSFIFETDVHKDSSYSDPTENHSAIMLNGNVSHATSGTLSAACDGTASGCRHSPANKFEEGNATDNYSAPSAHNQRIEIHTGCNLTCSTCNPASHLAPNTYARITAWVDCTDCSDVVADLNRTTKVPTIQRCTKLDVFMNSLFFGFTGGFRSTAGTLQSVAIKNFSLRSD